MASIRISGGGGRSSTRGGEPPSPRRISLFSSSSKKMERLVATTAKLCSEMEALDRMETAEQKMSVRGAASHPPPASIPPSSPPPPSSTTTRRLDRRSGPQRVASFKSELAPRRTVASNGSDALYGGDGAECFVPVPFGVPRCSDFSGKIFLQESVAGASSMPLQPVLLLEH